MYFCKCGKKIIIILVLLVFMTGCSINNSKKNVNNSKDNIRKSDKLLSEVVKVGDYVDYIPNGSRKEESDVNDNGALNQVVNETISRWRVLRIDGDNVILIGDTSKSSFKYSVAQTTINLKDKDKAFTMLNEPNRLCEKLYSSSYGKARNIQIEDINKIIEVDLKSDKVIPSNQSRTDKITCGGKEVNSYYSYSLKDFKEKSSIEYSLVGNEYHYIIASVACEKTPSGEENLYFWHNKKDFIGTEVMTDLYYIKPIVKLDKDVYVSVGNKGDGSKDKPYELENNEYELSHKSLKKDYKDFIKNRGFYRKLLNENFSDAETDYAIYDLNGDGIKELLLISKNSNDEFYNNAIYTYKENKIKFVGTLFSYRKIKYDSENNAIAYYPARTTGPYSLAKIEHDKLSQEVSGYASRDNIKDLKTNSIKF